MRIKSYQQQQKKKSSLPLLVMTGMCAAIITIVGQSLSHSSSYRVQGYTGLTFQDPIGQIEMMINNQQTRIQRYLNTLWGITPLSGGIGREEGPQFLDSLHSVASVAGGDQLSSSDLDRAIDTTSGEVSYDTFEDLKKKIVQQSCVYEIPMDNTDLRIAHILERGLKKCLITLSHTRKVNASDHLTHRTMRIIAERAGFVIKSEHMTDIVVSRDDFYSFVYTLQQQHQIGDLPVMSLSDPVKRIEWLSLLYMIFEDSQSAGSMTDMTALLPSTNDIKTSSGQQSSISIADFKSQLQSQGYQIQIMPYEADIALTPEIMQSIMDTLGGPRNNTLLSSDDNNDQTILSSVGIDKDMIKQTLSRLIEKI